MSLKTMSLDWMRASGKILVAINQVRDEPLRMSQLMKETDIHSQHITNCIERFVNEGILTIEASKKNDRYKVPILTPKGKVIAKELSAIYLLLSNENKD